MEKPAPAAKAPLAKAVRLLFGVLAPLPIAMLVFWALLTTTTGEGPSVGGRGMVLVLVLFPVGFFVGALLNCWVLFAPVTRRLSAFLLGAAVPALMLALGYAYLWRQGPFAH
jgi:hypothetical protein